MSCFFFFLSLFFLFLPIFHLTFRLGKLELSRGDNPVYSYYYIIFVGGGIVDGSDV